MIQPGGSRRAGTVAPDQGQVERGHGIDGRHDGIVRGNLLASYAHLRSVAGNSWAPRFVEFVRRERATAATPAG